MEMMKQDQAARQPLMSLYRKYMGKIPEGLEEATLQVVVERHPAARLDHGAQQVVADGFVGKPRDQVARVRHRLFEVPAAQVEHRQQHRAPR